MGMGRIGDIYTKSEDFMVFEEKIIEIITGIAEKKKSLTITEFLREIGDRIDDNGSIIKTAADRNIPIYAPGIIDSIRSIMDVYSG